MMESALEKLFDLAKRKRATIATAESCTGGLLAAALTEQSGASALFDRGFITYSNKAKVEVLGVNAGSLSDFGAVSEAVALEMADGARRAAGSTLAVSITGIAGPGGSDFKPEGRVCFGLAGPGSTTAKTVEFGALGRSNVRTASVQHAIELIISRLNALPGE